MLIVPSIYVRLYLDVEKDLGIWLASTKVVNAHYVTIDVANAPSVSITLIPRKKILVFQVEV